MSKILEGVIYRFSIDLIKILITFFIELEKKPKIYLETEKQLVKTIQYND